jgi:RNA-binding protein 5/10
MHDYGPKLTGETDQDPQQMRSQYVVVRGLDSAVDEEVLAKGIEQLYVDTAAPSKDAGENSAKPKLKSTAPTKSTTGLGARPHSLRRVFLMRDRRNDVTWKYGFAEFATAQDAQGAMAKFHGMEQFKINSKPVVVAFIHTGVFVPANGPADEGRFSFAPIYNENLSLKYWDDRGYPSALIVNTVSDMGAEEETDKAKSSSTDAKDTQSARDILRKVKKDVTAREKKPAIMAPQVQMWARKRAELQDDAKKAGGADNASTPESEKRDPPKTKYGLPRQLPADNMDLEGRFAGKDDEAGERAMHRRDTFDSYGLQSSTDGKWTCTLCAEAEVFETVQAMIDHHILDAAHTSALRLSEKLTRADAALAAKGAAKHKKQRRAPRLRSDAAPEYISYADPVHLVCLVCDPPRRFTSKHVLRLHETESILHKEAMANRDNVLRAEKRLGRLGLHPRMMKPKQQSDSSNDPAYRDRARERRTAFSQKSKPKADSAARDKQDVGKDSDVEAKKPSRGAALLGKMGWAAGSGLGAEGTGRTDAIASELYVPGVGLGAAGGKAGDAAEEAARNTRGEFSDFVQKTRDKARERYERLG